MSNVGPLGTAFRFGDSGEGLCTMALGSDNFLGGAAAKSIASDLREGTESVGVEAELGATAADADSRLSSPRAVVRGAEPRRRRGSSESPVNAEDEDCGA